MAGRPAMRLVQALRWKRDTLNNDDGLRATAARVARILADPSYGPVLRTDLAKSFSALPAWMQDMLRPHLADQLAADFDQASSTSA